MDSLANPYLAGVVGAAAFTIVLFVVGRMHLRLTAPYHRTDTGSPPEDEIIDALRKIVPRFRRNLVLRPRVQSRELQHPYAPAKDLEIRAAEDVIGRPLPSLLRRVYAEVANGGFGPAYGLLGVSPGAVDSLGGGLAQAYERYSVSWKSDDPAWSWPEGVVPVIELGCTSFLCVDLTSPSLPVIQFEVADSEVPDAEVERAQPLFRPFASSLGDLLLRWVQGEVILK